MFNKYHVHVVRVTQELVYRRYSTLICQPDFSSERMGVVWEVERHGWLRPSTDCTIARKGEWKRRKEGYTPLPIRNPYSLLSYLREGGSQAATPLRAQNGWKEVAEVELLPSFSKEERESNLTTACFMWDRTRRKMGKRKTGHLLTQHPEIQQKYQLSRWESWSGMLPLKLSRL